MVVYKYHIAMGGLAYKTLPEGAEIIHVAAQRDEPFFWALVDPKAELVTRQFVLVGTGHNFAPQEAERMKHIGSFLTDQEGTFVFHFFEMVSDE